MFITLNPNSDIPIFQQLHDRIIEAIARGDIQDGDKLDPVRKVAAEFGINPATVQKAYDLLRAEGIISTTNRSGSLVHISNTAPSSKQQEEFNSAISQTLARALIHGFSEKEIQQKIEELFTTYRRAQA